MSGGVALNCVANGRILRDGPFKRLFVQPAASDLGSALGAAAVAHVRMTGTRPTGREMRQVYLGPSYSGEQVESLLDAATVAATDFRGKTDELIAHTARLLADGKVVGWFQGRMEFGPRALGARSILADPRDPSMRDKINAQVKKREGFRPFAPAVLEERAKEHFVLDQPSRFMLATCHVKSPLSLPAVTHVDGSARVQTVTDEDNALFAKLLREFDRLTGCPILLNTSFNLRGEPMVLSPWDAFACYVRSDIDHLVLGDFVVERSAITPSIQELGERYDLDLRDRRRAPGHVSEKAYAFV